MRRMRKNMMIQANTEILAKFEAVLATRGVHQALRFLNGRVPHRFTGVYRFEPPMLRSVCLVDGYDLTVRRGDDAPLESTYCSIVGRTGGPFASENAGRDGRLAGHPARGSVIAYCGVLLDDPGGAPFGTLCHFDAMPCDVPVHEMPLMHAAAPLLYRAVARL